MKGELGHIVCNFVAPHCPTLTLDVSMEVAVPLVSDYVQKDYEYRVGEAVIIQCLQGFQFVNAVSFIVLRCADSGVWDPPLNRLPSCTITV